jgi:WhiB family transcriptional regulator, redox-sensing transcriptional regulator
VEENLDWQELASCTGKPAAWWFPANDLGAVGGVDAYAEARPICMTCPVKASCAKAGANERFGMWGGLTPTQRRLKRSAA